MKREPWGWVNWDEIDGNTRQESIKVESLQAPGSIKIISGIGFVETTAIIVYSVLMVFATGQSDLGAGRIIALALFFVVIALTIALSAYKLLQGKPSARSMLLVWQLFIVIMSVQAIIGGQLFLGLFGTALSGAAIILLFSTAANNYIEAHSQR